MAKTPAKPARKSPAKSRTSSSKSAGKTGKHLAKVALRKPTPLAGRKTATLKSGGPAAARTIKSTGKASHATKPAVRGAAVAAGHKVKAIATKQAKAPLGKAAKPLLKLVTPTAPPAKGASKVVPLPGKKSTAG